MADETVAVAPVPSVIVSVTCGGRVTPASVLSVSPQVSVNESCSRSQR